MTSDCAQSGNAVLRLCSPQSPYGQSRAKVPFLVVRDLAVDCKLGTSFIDRHVKHILPGLQKGVVYHSSTVAITS